MKIRENQTTNENDLKDKWENSYSNGDNFLFYPSEEVIRFVSRHITKRTGINSFSILHSLSRTAKILDLGCGIGRHVKYCLKMGLDAYGIDFSETAISFAKRIISEELPIDIEKNIKQGDIRHLPWADGFFDYAISHGVLDSMPYSIAREGCTELARVIQRGGLFYCDLISGDDSNHSPSFSGEETVETDHERDTIQLYYNDKLIQELFGGFFEIVEHKLIRHQDILAGTHRSRHHLVLLRS